MLRSYLLGAATFAVVGCIFVWDGDAPELIAAAVAGALFWTLILVLITLLNYLLVPARARRMFAQQKALHCAVVVKRSDEAISPRVIQLRVARFCRVCSER